MPHTVKPTRERNRPIAQKSGIPGGYSDTSKKLSEHVITSLAGFYGSSEVLSYYSPQFPLDNAGVVERIVREVLNATLGKLQRLATWKAGWNGYDAQSPDAGAISHAQTWIVKLFLAAADLDSLWIEPNVTADTNGDIVFEWWHGNKKLTVYIGKSSAEYVQVWGADIHSEMLDGDAESDSACRSLWLWLVS